MLKNIIAKTVDLKLKCCPHCNYKNNDWANVKRHIEFNHPEHYEKKYFCDECDKSCIFEISVSAHKARKHRTFVCEFCGTSYNDKTRHTHHMNIKHSKSSMDHVWETCVFFIKF